MDWLRRNWPDLLIGVALIAVIAGIIATLISGGSFFPVRDRVTETPRPTTPLTSTQTPSQQQAQTPVVPTTPAAGDQPPAVAVDPSAQSAAGQTPATPAEPAQPEQASSQSAVSSTPSQAQAAQPLPPEPAAQQPAQPTQSSVSSSVTQQPAAQQPAAQQPSSSASAPLPSASSEAPYRVSVGAFANADNARRQLEAFQAAGFPAFIGTQGNLNIVLVGPYDTEDEARSVAARISANSSLGVPDPTVYRLQDDEAASQPAPAAQQGAQAATPAAQPAAQSPSAQTPAAEPEAAAATPSAATRYLQVGAYGSRDSAQPQRDRLEAMGFVVTDRVENGLVKLLVGPFDASELASAQARLQSAGIESFPR